MRAPPILLPALLAAALGLTSCGRGESSAASGDPGAVVGEYVKALDEHDGERFCATVAPYISGRADLYFRDPDVDLPQIKDCAGFASTFIGYVEDCGAPPREFKGVELLGVEGVEGRGKLRLVRARIRPRQKDTCRSDHPVVARTRVEPVWLAHFDGEWRVAKLGRLAQEASLSTLRFPEEARVPTDEQPDEPPDVDAEQRAYAALVDGFDRRMTERDVSFRPANEPRDCSGGLSMEDPRGDAAAASGRGDRTPSVPAGDLTRLQVAVEGASLCVRWDLAGDRDRPLILFFSHTTGERDFTFFNVEVREDGLARVTTFDDPDNHPIVVPAVVGADGSAVSLVLDAGSFEAATRPYSDRGDPSDQSFTFGTGVKVAPNASGGSVDYVGADRPDRYHYPDGRVCESSC